jgi:hypothetical protein
MLCVLYYTIILHFIVCTADRIVLHSTVLYRSTLHCTALYCTVLYCTVLYCTVLYCTLLLCDHSLFCSMSALYVSHCVCCTACAILCAVGRDVGQREVVAEDMTGSQRERNGVSECA